MELEIGVLRLERRADPHGSALRTWLSGVRRLFAGCVLAVDETVATRCAGLHVPDPRPERDALWAATAIVHGFTMVTLNQVDFMSTGVRLFNPWQATGT